MRPQEILAEELFFFFFFPRYQLSFHYIYPFSVVRYYLVKHGEHAVLLRALFCHSQSMDGH